MTSLHRARRANRRGRARAPITLGLLGGILFTALMPLMSVLLIAAPEARALEALNGRIQAHGYFEMQLRGITAGYSEQFDLTQWYNIFDLEIEVDLVRSTHGPVDLVSAFARAEVRFDCIYSRGCGLLRGVDVYGDRARNLPERLSNGRSAQMSGALVVEDRPEVERRWVDDGTTLAAVSDPNGYVAGHTDARRISTLHLAEINPSSQPMLLSDISPYSTFAGQAGADGYDAEPAPVSLHFDDPFPTVFQNFYRDFRFTTVQGYGGKEGGLPKTAMGPWLPKNDVVSNAGLSDRKNPFDDRTSQANDIVKAAFFNTGVFTAAGYDRGSFVLGTESTYYDQSLSDYYGASSANTPATLRAAGEAAEQTAAGGGALPLRPIPARVASAKLGDWQGGAKGLFIPSKPLMDFLESGKMSDYEFNISEIERAFNHGASQQQTGALKELYFDIEMFESRLWLRLGKQSIVWGKTELFRTTDQFNPQDLALASLPSLEESRIALWAARGVYSFYDVGPLQDVRLELALNFDEFQPNDLGACGEPYTLNVVCVLTFANFSHGLTGVTVAGSQRPGDPWDDISGLEIGGRIEFRYDRFSFAIMDFWGYEDMPYLHRLSTYDRNVDPITGRPRYMAATDACLTADDATALGLPGGVAASFGGCLTPGISQVDPTGDPTGATNLAGNITNLGVGSAYNALEYHHANQQLFGVICSTTIGFSSLDLAACGQTIFGSKASPLAGLDIVNIFSAALAGGELANGVLTFSTDVASILAIRNPIPLVVPNRDANDDLARGTSCMTNSGNPVECGRGGNGPFDDPPLFGAFGFTEEALGPFLTPEQEALLGCGPLWGTDCDNDGVDLLNAEASVLLQSFPGLEGSNPAHYGGVAWTTKGVKRADGTFNTAAPQPGTLGFAGVGGPIGTYRVEPGERGRLDAAGSAYQVVGDQIVLKLPGSRGPADFASFGYSPGVDGCIRASGTAAEAACAASNGGAGANMLYHPSFNPSTDVHGYFNPTGPNYDADAQEQVFATEMAAVSWNFLMVLTALDAMFTSRCDAGGDQAVYRACAWDETQCSFAAPEKCSTVAAVYAVVGVTRNTVRASGASSPFGRRTFIWHSGGEVVTRYAKRNVLGFSMDFAEDRTKSNFSLEATWIGSHPVADNDSWSGVSEVDDINLTISMDRPTFINFLNPNRTFFFNAQFFTRYRSGYGPGMTANGPYTFLATFAVSTGYFQDRLLPSFISVVDFNSPSGAIIGQLAYRFTQSFSVALGGAGFFGGINYRDVPVNDTSIVGNQQGPRAYQVGVENGLSAVRDRDEVFMRLRYTF